MVVYAITGMYVRNDDSGVHTQIFADEQQAMKAFLESITDLQNEFEQEIATGTYEEYTEEKEQYTEYMLFDFDNPNDFLERVVLTTYDI